MSESGSEWTSDSEVGNDIASSQENDIASSQEVDNPSSQGGKAGKKCSLCFRLCGFDAPPADGHNAAGCVLVRHTTKGEKDRTWRDGTNRPSNQQVSDEIAQRALTKEAIHKEKEAKRAQKKADNLIMTKKGRCITYEEYYGNSVSRFGDFMDRARARKDVQERLRKAKANGGTPWNHTTGAPLTTEPYSTLPKSAERHAITPKLRDLGNPESAGSSRLCYRTANSTTPTPQMRKFDDRAPTASHLNNEGEHTKLSEGIRISGMSCQRGGSSSSSSFRQHPITKPQEASRAPDHKTLGFQARAGGPGGGLVGRVKHTATHEPPHPVGNVAPLPTPGIPIPHASRCASSSGTPRSLPFVRASPTFSDLRATAPNTAPEGRSCWPNFNTTNSALPLHATPYPKILASRHLARPPRPGAPKLPPPPTHPNPTEPCPSGAPCDLRVEASEIQDNGTSSTHKRKFRFRNE